jgi:hypothetical protein
MYPGNSIGGVITIHTRMPESFEFQAGGGFFVQEFKDYGTDDTYLGFRFDAAAGDKIGRVGYFVNYRHLQNEAQPASFRFTHNPGLAGAGDPIVTGGFLELDATGTNRVVFGSIGRFVVDDDDLVYRVRCLMRHDRLQEPVELAVPIPDRDDHPRRWIDRFGRRDRLGQSRVQQRAGELVVIRVVSDGIAAPPPRKCLGMGWCELDDPERSATQQGLVLLGGRRVQIDSERRGQREVMRVGHVTKRIPC